jgi:D-3-phosphoglycerate dehydrogenase
MRRRWSVPTSRDLIGVSVVLIAYGPPAETGLEREFFANAGLELRHLAGLEVGAQHAALGLAGAFMVTTQPVNADLLDKMPKCRIVARVGVGLDGIDLDAAAERGIWVANVPDYAVDEVSTHTLALLLARARKLPRLMSLGSRGIWDQHEAGHIERLSGQTLGLLGFGRIGRVVCAKARALGLNVLVHDPLVSVDVVRKAHAALVPWETLLRNADYLSMHAPLTPLTHQIINPDSLSLMKPSAFLINTARGALIDEAALLDAVRRRLIAGAALDVLAEEPPPRDHPFFDEEEIWITPHAAWYSEASTRDVRVKACQEVRRVLQGRRPHFPVNSPIVPSARKRSISPRTRQRSRGGIKVGG